MRFNTAGTSIKNHSATEKFALRVASCNTVAPMILGLVESANVCMLAIGKSHHKRAAGYE